MRESICRGRVGNFRGNAASATLKQEEGHRGHGEIYRDFRGNAASATLKRNSLAESNAGGLSHFRGNAASATLKLLCIATDTGCHPAFPRQRCLGYIEAGLLC